LKPVFPEKKEGYFKNKRGSIYPLFSLFNSKKSIFIKKILIGTDVNFQSF